ncbi:hypothetical protein DBV15_10275 [Temnothorax longispinosus]|uniref:Uncharacterized protein n=1 Tax=Temnothorax longispinosus TaxID=300112 RepID=A0A4S2KZN0_9HYME|nr:hypothetical protein DBV15_10275 [Temnothorax longispinosus]
MLRAYKEGIVPATNGMVSSARMSGRVGPLTVEREGMWFRVDQATDRETKPLPHTFCFKNRDCGITFSKVSVLDSSLFDGELMNFTEECVLESGRAPKRGCEFADRMVFSNKVRFPGLPKEAAPDFVGTAKITTPVEWQRLSLACRVSTGGSSERLEGRLPAGWSEESPGMVTEVTGKPRGWWRDLRARMTKRPRDRTTPKGRGDEGWGTRRTLRSVRMASTRVREDLSPWSSLLSSGGKLGRMRFRGKTRRDGSFLFRGRRSSFPRAVSSSWTNCLVTGGSPVAFRDVRNPTLSICLGTSHPPGAVSSRLYLPNRFADDRERTTGPWSRKKSMEYLAFMRLRDTGVNALGDTGGRRAERQHQSNENQKCGAINTGESIRHPLPPPPASPPQLPRGVAGEPPRNLDSISSSRLAEGIAFQISGRVNEKMSKSGTNGRGESERERERKLATQKVTGCWSHLETGLAFFETRVLARSQLQILSYRILKVFAAIIPVPRKNAFRSGRTICNRLPRIDEEVTRPETGALNCPSHNGVFRIIAFSVLRPIQSRLLVPFFAIVCLRLGYGRPPPRSPAFHLTHYTPRETPSLGEKGPAEVPEPCRFLRDFFPHLSFLRFDGIDPERVALQPFRQSLPSPPRRRGGKGDGWRRAVISNAKTIPSSNRAAVRVSTYQQHGPVRNAAGDTYVVANTTTMPVLSVLRGGINVSFPIVCNAVHSPQLRNGAPCRSFVSLIFLIEELVNRINSTPALPVRIYACTHRLSLIYDPVSMRERGSAVAIEEPTEDSAEKRLVRNGTARGGSSERKMHIHGVDEEPVSQRAGTVQSGYPSRHPPATTRRRPPPASLTVLPPRAKPAKRISSLCTPFPCSSPFSRLQRFQIHVIKLAGSAACAHAKSWPRRGRGRVEQGDGKQSKEETRALDYLTFFAQDRRNMGCEGGKGGCAVVLPYNVKCVPVRRKPMLLPTCMLDERGGMYDVHRILAAGYIGAD